MRSPETCRPSANTLNCFVTCLVLVLISCVDTAVAEEIETKDGGVPVIRLSTKTGAQGWIGRRRPNPKDAAANADKTRITSPRLQHLNDVPSPPPAPPEEPESDHPRLNIHPQKPAHKVPARTTQQISPTAQSSHSPDSMKRTNKEVTTASILHTVSQANKSNAPPAADSKTVPPAPPATEKKAAAPKGSETNKTKASPASDNPSTNTEPPMLLDDLSVSRPLRNISLSAAIRAVGIDGQELRKPEDQAGPMFAKFGVYHDLPVFQADGQGWCCDFPIFYNPLYFEDPNMERCGQGYGCFTEAASIVRFFGRIPLVPYLKGSNPPCTCVRSLGNCPACHQFGMDAYIPPLNVPGVAAQAAATVALVFLIP